MPPTGKMPTATRLRPLDNWSSYDSPGVRVDPAPVSTAGVQTSIRDRSSTTSVQRVSLSVLSQTITLFQKKEDVRAKDKQTKMHNFYHKRKGT